MRHLVVAIGLLTALAAPNLLAQEPAQRLRAAIYTEEVDGDWRAALAEYREVAAGRDRSAAATAYVRIGELLLKHPDAGSALAAFETVTRDFLDQPEAVALARARLAQARAATGQSETTRFAQVGGPNRGPIEGTVSSDGRYLSLTDWDTGNLALRDLATGADRLLTDDAKPPQELAQSSTISRDGRLVAYSWWNGMTRAYELRVVPVQGAPSKPRQLYAAPNGSSMTPFDWSPDGRWIAVALYARRPAPSQFGVVSTETGILRILGDANTSTLKFSPDGQLLAFDTRQETSGQVKHHISAVTIDGSRVTDLVTADSND